MRETLEAARARLRESLGSGARFDAEAAPAAKLLAMRLARSACQRQVSRIGDDALQNPSLALTMAQLGCVARAIAEAFEATSGHEGIEGDHAGRGADLSAEITLARTLPGRALRALYLHALQHLDVACRDLDADGWSTRADITGFGLIAPENAIDQMASLLRQAAEIFRGFADHDRLLPPLSLSLPTGVQS